MLDALNTEHMVEWRAGMRLARDQCDRDWPQWGCAAEAGLGWVAHERSARPMLDAAQTPVGVRDDGRNAVVPCGFLTVRRMLV